MAKVYYSENDEIANLIRNNISDTNSSLSNARNYCVFRGIPSDFVYINYLNNLYNQIQNYVNRANSIMKIAGSIDNSYRLLNDSLDSVVNALDVNVIAERNRLIK